MRPRFAVALSAFLIGGFAVTRSDATPLKAQSIVEAERAFARASVEMGMREAFLEFLDDSAVVFRPQPVNGKEFYRGRPPSPGALIWQPAHAELAAAGDMGYTTGPWEYREGGPEGKAIAWGYYISVWHATPDSGWKVLADIGVGLEAPVDSVVVRDVRIVRSSAIDSARFETAAAVRELLDRDRALGAAVARDGFAKALDGAATDDVRLYRDGAPPSVGRDTAMRELTARGGSWSWTPMAGGVAVSGDFGYTYGTADPVSADPKAAGPGSYLRVWRRAGLGSWQVALEVIISGPAKKN